MSKGELELTERDKNGNDVNNKQERQPEVDHEQDTMVGCYVNSSRCYLRGHVMTRSRLELI